MKSIKQTDPPKLTVYPTIEQKTFRHTTLSKVYEYVRDGQRGLDEITEKMHRLYLHNKDEYDESKRNLVNACLNGTFEECPATNDSLITHSGLVTLDYDKLEPSFIAEASAELAQRPEVRFSFVTPSAHGLKVSLEVNPIPDIQAENLADLHKAAYCSADMLFSDFMPQADISCADLRRTHYLAYDPHAIYNPNSTPIDWDIDALEEYEEFYHVEGIVIGGDGNARQSAHADKLPTGVGKPLPEITTKEEWLTIAKEGGVRPVGTWKKHRAGYDALRVFCPFCERDRCAYVTFTEETKSIGFGCHTNTCKVDNGDPNHVSLYVKAGYRKSERRRELAPILVKTGEGGGDDEKQYAALDALRQQFSAELEAFKSEENNSQQVLIFRYDTGVGKTYTVIVELENLLHVAPHGELTDESYQTAKSAGKDAFRWRSRRYGFETVCEAVGYPSTELTEEQREFLAEHLVAPENKDEEGRSQAMCVYPDVVERSLRRGHSAQDVCKNCPIFKDCTESLYLSQYRTAWDFSQVFISLPELQLISDKRFASWAEQLGQQRTAVVDDCPAEAIPPRILITLPKLTSLLAERSEEDYKDIETSFEPAHSTHLLKEMIALVKSDENLNEARKRIRDSDDFSLHKAVIELSQIPFYFMTSDGNLIIDVSERFYTSEPDDTNDEDIELPDELFSREEDVLHRHFFYADKAWRIGLLSHRDIPNIVEEEDGWADAFCNTKNTVRRTKVNGYPAIEVIMPTVLNFEKTIIINASAHEDDFRRVLPPSTDITFKTADALEWKEDCRVFQIHNARYTDASFFEKTHNEIIAPGPRLADVCAVMSKQLERGEKVLVVGRKALQREPISKFFDELREQMPTGAELAVINYGGTVGINKYAHFDTGFYFLPTPSQEDLEHTAAALYSDEFDDLDFETRVDGTVEILGFAIQMQIYADARVQAIAERRIREDIYQAVMRLRPMLFAGKTIVLLTGFPVDGLTNRADTTFFSLQDALTANCIQEIKPKLSVNERLEQGESVKDIAETEGVSQGRIYQIKGVVDKSERDAQIKELAAEGLTDGEIGKRLDIHRTTVARIRKKMES